MRSLNDMVLMPSARGLRCVDLLESVPLNKQLIHFHFEM